MCVVVVAVIMVVLCWAGQPERRGGGCNLFVAPRFAFRGVGEGGGRGTDRVAGLHLMLEVTVRESTSDRSTFFCTSWSRLVFSDISEP